MIVLVCALWDRGDGASELVTTHCYFSGKNVLFLLVQELMIQSYRLHINIYSRCFPPCGKHRATKHNNTPFPHQSCSINNGNFGLL